MTTTTGSAKRQLPTTPPVALITGCSSGIGQATATLLAERGWRVYASARRIETLTQLESERLTPLQLDVTDETSMAAAVGQVLHRAGRIDALVNNAGYGQGGPLEEATAEEIRAQFETNTFGPLRLAQLVLGTMRAQGSGRIVNLSTMGGRVSLPFIGLYCASKFALEALSDALRIETRPFGVQVILIEPGSVDTNFHSTATAHSARFATDRSSPYHRYFDPFNRAISGSHSWPPERVARVIHQALTVPRPHARYAPTPDARLMLTILPRLPDRKRDALLSRLAGLRAASTAGDSHPAPAG